jgi:copper oxidase (laccase) domain-containing protein
MKVISHGSQVPSVSDGKTVWTESGATEATAWPAAFIGFLAELNEPLELKELHFDSESNWVSVKHGRFGSRVIWTREINLPQSWRVSAFHSNRVVTLESFDSTSLERADGIAVDGKNFLAPLAIQTADCLAVAMTAENDSQIRFASCFHAGWRGFTGAIQHNAMQLLKSAVSSQKKEPKPAFDIFITIGPAIAGKCYPCGEDVLNAFRQHHAQSLKPLPGWSDKHDQVFWEMLRFGPTAETGKVYPDLQALMCLELHALGVPLKGITVFRDDTFGSSHWPSHRRAMAQGLPRAGRLITHLCPPTCPQVTNHASRS